jgi:hypothetical protein
MCHDFSSGVFQGRAASRGSIPVRPAHDSVGIDADNRIVKEALDWRQTFAAF